MGALHCVLHASAGLLYASARHDKITQTALNHHTTKRKRLTTPTCILRKLCTYAVGMSAEACKPAWGLDKHISLKPDSPCHILSNQPCNHEAQCSGRHQP